MKENVNIFIEGIVHGEDDSSIITRATGVYRILDDVHILKYMDRDVKRDEESDASDKEPLSPDEDCVNTIKISSGLIEMIKIGENSTHMVFDLSRSTQAVYDTLYGSLYFQIETRNIDIEEKDNAIILNMDYSLSHENSHISDNSIHLIVNEVN